MKNKPKRVTNGMALVCGVVALFTTAVVAIADGTPSATNGPSHGRMKAAVAACAKSSGITMPQSGTNEVLSTADRQTLHSCLATYRSSMRSCAANAGISKPAPGTRPSLTTAQKASLSQCRTQAISQIAASSAAGS